eukprot:TRINITY_DN67131_c1_g1_i1.p1 TRINITY_DN67131_c1_g1~~TRINITY_DN67131_c1_g1_i1.p1  ORF type:complete len:307 (-),score=5.39 TRINITY_DN67131_c1_g1_i1:68-988(-)
MLTNEYTLVNTAFSAFITQLADIQTVAETKWETFKQQRAELEQKVRSCNANSSKKVQLDIGGTVFSTTESTLLKEKDTFFWALLHSGEWKPDEDGLFFIDRSPNTFGLILEYLRTGKVCTDHLTRMEQQMLRKDVDFYQIGSFPPFTPVRWNRHDLGGDDTVLLTDDGHTMVRTKPSQEKKIFRGLLPHSGSAMDVISWKVTAKFSALDHLGGCSVGVLNNPVIALRSGDFLNRGDPSNTWSKFAQWPDECASRTVEFQYDPVSTTLTVGACGAVRTVHLGVSPTPPPIMPIVVCSQTQNVSFTIE